MFPQVFRAERGHRDVRSASWFLALLEEASCIGFFPEGKAGARGSPGVHHFGVGPRVRAEPFEQIENERL